MTRLGRFLRLGFIAGDLRTFTIIHQLTFALLLAASTITLGIFREENARYGWMSAGLIVLAVATTGAFFTTRFRTSDLPNILIPLLDFVALGLSRAGSYPDGIGLSILAFTPTVWLVITLRQRGAVIALVATLLTLTPLTMFGGSIPVDAAQILVALILPVTVALVSGMLVGFDLRVRRANERLRTALERQERLTGNLRQTTELLRGVGSSVTVGIIVLDENGRSIFENEAFKGHMAAASSTDSDESGSVNPAVFCADATTPVPAGENPLARARRGENFSDWLYWVGMPDSDQRALSMSAIPWYGHATVNPHTIMTTYDVTATQRLIRTREEFLASVSHEFRTPLTSILGYTDLAIDELEDSGEEHSALASALADYLDVIRRNSEQLSALVEDVLLEQRAGSHRLHLSNAELDLRRVVDEVVGSLCPTARIHEVSLSSAGGERLIVHADAKRLTQVLTNLVFNAIKYAGTGASVNVIVVSDAHGDGFDVADDGVGIAAEDVERLFTPFYRGSAARTSTKRGVGLGLAVTKSIVDAHGGTITVDSEPGRGSTFSVRLPTCSENRADGDSTDLTTETPRGAAEESGGTATDHVTRPEPAARNGDRT